MHDPQPIPPAQGPEQPPTGPAPRPPPGVPFRPAKKVLTKPRRVRGGIRLSAREGEALGNWIGQRVMRVLEDGVPGDVVREGLEYGRLGQVRRLELEGDAVSAQVQGRRQRAYAVRIGLTAFPPEERDRVIAAMAEQSRYAAKLLAGELPPNIEDLFAPLGLRLFPSTAAEMLVACDCAEAKPWCKHQVCVAALLAERMSADPFLVFALRGLPGDVLIDALRQKRAIAGLGAEIAPVHLSHVPGVSGVESAPLASLVDEFWNAVPGDDGFEGLVIEPPAVSHGLLRRLGPSPFTESRFRFVGLLATCYDMVSEHVLRGYSADAQSASDDPNTAR